MGWKRHITPWLLAAVALLVAGCDDGVVSAPGTIEVTVVDVGGPTNLGVTVRVEPGGLIATTDAEGVARFQVPPGRHYVDARLCCHGVALIEYHVPVDVAGGQTETVTLQMCSICA